MLGKTSFSEVFGLVWHDYHELVNVGNCVSYYGKYGCGSRLIKLTRQNIYTNFSYEGKNVLDISYGYFLEMEWIMVENYVHIGFCLNPILPHFIAAIAGCCYNPHFRNELKINKIEYLSILKEFLKLISSNIEVLQIGRKWKLICYNTLSIC